MDAKFHVALFFFSFKESSRRKKTFEMAVLLETTYGDIVIDLHVNECPVATKNFLKLCKIKYYNNCLFHNIQKDYVVQTGDPTNTGKGGESIYG